MTLKPKRNNLYSLSIIVVVYVLLAIVISTEDSLIFNKISFGSIVLILLRSLYYKFETIIDETIFTIQGRKSIFLSIISVIGGVSMIFLSARNSDFLTGLNLEWINNLLLGIILITQGVSRYESISFHPKTLENIEIRNYNLSLNSDINQIQIFKNKIIILNNKDEHYQFEKLQITEQDKTKFSNWLGQYFPSNKIQIIWSS